MTTSTLSHPQRRRARHRALAVLAATGCLVVAACGPPPTSGAKNSTAGTTKDTLSKITCPLGALKKAKGKVKVVLWYGGLGEETQRTMENEAKAFNASQSKIQVIANNQGASYDEVLRKYNAAAAAGKAGRLPGVLMAEDTALGGLVDRGTVLPAEACMRADGYDPDQILASVRGSWSVNGVMWPGYVNVSAPVLYFNKAHFERAGLDPNKPPQTLEEVYQDAKKIKAAGVAPKPFVLKLDEWFFETWLSGVGVNSVNKDNGHAGTPTAATFDNPTARRLLKFFKKMQDEGLLNVFANTPGKIDHYLALVTKQSSMLVETSAAATTIRGALSGDITADDVGGTSTAGLNTDGLVPGAAQLPGIEKVGQVHPSGAAFYILNTQSPAQQAASWKFLRFMLEPKNVTEWYKNGSYQPIVKKVADTPEIKQFWTGDVAGALLKSAYDELSASDPDQTRPLLGPYLDYKQIVQGAMEAIFLNGQPIDSTLAAAQAKATDLLKRYAAN